jgi:hypothetical protein
MRRHTLSVLLVAGLLLISGTATLAGAAPADAERAQTLDGASAATIDAGAGQAQSDAVVRGRPDLSVMLPDSTVTPGRTNELTLQVANDGTLNFGSAQNRQIVTTARNVRVEADAGGTPMTVETDQMGIGSVTEDQPREFSVAVDVPDDIEPGTYDLDVELRYSYRSFQGGAPIGSSANERTRVITEEVEIEVKDRARFAVVGVDADAQIGDSGTLTVDVENTGSEPAYRADVGLTSTASGLTFGGADSSTARIGELAPGETSTVTYDVTVVPDSPVREYAINADVRFEDPEGISRTDEDLSFGVFPQAEQEFTIDDVSSDLRVGEDGDLVGTVTNDGPATARNVVVRYADDSPNVIPIEDSVAVGTLEAGESAEFRLPLEISGEAEAIGRVAGLTVRYRNDDDELRRYDDVEAVYTVGAERDDFLVEVDDREVETGSTQTINVTVTNNLDETVSDVEARLFADSPLDSENDEGFTESLDPGESTTMTFTLSADGGATAKTYPVSFDFRYDDADGNSQLSDTSRVAITLVESEGGFPLFSVFGLLVTVAVAGGAVYYTQRE